ncbi:MAG: FMN-binding protein [Elusimicrobiota bacterium]
MKNLFVVLFIFILGRILVLTGKPDNNPAGEKAFTEGPVILKEGSFKGRGEGFVGDIIVEVEIKETDREPYYMIEDVNVVETSDIEKYFLPAKEKVVSWVLKEQNTDVDVITEATKSKQGLIEAIEDALEKAR